MAAARLREFSFFSVRADGRTYDMHKLVQEAARYSLRGTTDEAFFSRAALRVMADLFPDRRRELWEQCEKYLVHAQRVGEWAELSGEAVETSALLTRVSDYLYDRGRWREKEPVDVRAYELRKTALGERHPDTIRSMADLQRHTTPKGGTTRPRRSISRGPSTTARGPWREASRYDLEHGESCNDIPRPREVRRGREDLKSRS